MEAVLLDKLQHIQQSLHSHKPSKSWRRFLVKRSAVAMILRTNDADIEVLMIKRAEYEGDPWSGHMAFPGGRLERGDKNSLATARRETLEEIGFDTQRHCEYLGRLSDVQARTRSGPKPMIVTPYLFQARHVPELVLDTEEVADVLWIPLSHFAEPGNRQAMDWEFAGKPVSLPCYFFNQQRIWGLSLMMLDELLAIAQGGAR
jgi:8-oxo-dGTP pyrophosphatase MutT (NUDIX family)